MKKLLAGFALAALFTSSPASAFSIQVGGPTGMTVFFNAYGTGVLPSAVDGTFPAGPQLIDASTYGGSGSITTDDDFFGVFNVTAWFNAGGSGPFSPPPTSNPVYGVFYGFENLHGTAGPNQSVYHTGGRMDFYEMAPAADFGTIAGAGLGGYVANNTAAYTGITNVGSHLFSIEAIPGELYGITEFGAVGDDDVTTNRFGVNYDGDLDGSGDFFGQVVEGEGSHWQYFDNNSTFTNASPDAVNPALPTEGDFKVSYSMDAAANNQGVPSTDWLFQLSSGNIKTSVQPIPEPSTLLLLGTGLLGMVGYARRRKAA